LIRIQIWALCKEFVNGLDCLLVRVNLKNVLK
jgi:hypothetical protein